MTDARIGVIRDAMLMGYGLFMADAQIRELLAALDKIGAPLPAAQTVSLGDLIVPVANFKPRLPPFDGVEEAQMLTADELTQKPQGSDDFILDLIADAQAHDERRAP